VEAAPAADVVVVWAPGQSLAPVAKVVQADGAALIDKSPQPPPPENIGDVLARGIAAYNALRLDEARALLDQAHNDADRTGAAGLTTTQLADLFLYRGLVRAQQEDPSAWDELVASIVIDPTRQLDPAQFPPQVAQQLQRARDATLHDRTAADLEIDAPPGCAIFVDGAASPARTRHIAGSHWVRVTCPDHKPWGQRVDLTALGAHVPAGNELYAPPAEAELLVQARVAGARAMVIAEVHGQVATARLIDLDGRERDRRTVTIGADLAPLAGAIGELLEPATSHHPWYTSKWAYAGAAAVIAAALLVPITAAIAGNTGPTSAGIRPKGLPPL